MVQAIDTCDSCQSFTLCNQYNYKGELFVWCEDCSDEQATLIPYNI